MVTKHVLLAAEFIPYRPRLLGFHSLHVNAMKCIYSGFSLSKLQSFFWKISLNSRLIRLEGFNNKISPILLCVQRGLVIKRYPGASKAPRSNPCKTFFSSLLFFSFLLFFFFCFSFSFHVCYVSTYSLQFLDLQIFFSALLAVPQKSFARSCDLRISGICIFSRKEVQILHSGFWNNF